MFWQFVQFIFWLSTFAVCVWLAHRYIFQKDDEAAQPAPKVQGHSKRTDLHTRSALGVTDRKPVLTPAARPVHHDADSESDLSD